MKILFTIFILFASVYILKHYFPDMETWVKVVLSIVGGLIGVIVLLATDRYDPWDRIR